ncbi:MAG: CoA transferase [Desulfobacterales bacterium]
MHPLEKVRVADFTTMINGPYATMMLSDMGADVIKIEPPYGDSWRAVGGGFLSCNRGKRAVAVDLKKAEGRQVVFDIIETSNIVVENARWGVWHKLGLDYESVKEKKPDLIYLSILSFGSTGPDGENPGFDPVLQARSGQMVGQGGIGKPPVYHLIALNDQAAPMLGAYGAVLALLSQIRHGKTARRVETSLTNASIALQAGEFVDYEGENVRRPGDTDLRGLNALIRLYQAADGRWLQLCCPYERDWQNLCRIPEFDFLLSDPRFASSENRIENDAALTGLLSKTITQKTVTDWIPILQENEVPAAPAQSADEVLQDSHCLKAGVFDDRKDSVFGMARLVGIGPQFSESSGIIRRPAPLLGEHTEEVLTEIGYAKEKIRALRKAKVIYY